jgi:hypothetical protein
MAVIKLLRNRLPGVYIDGSVSHATGHLKKDPGAGLHLLLPPEWRLPGTGSHGVCAGLCA